MNEALEKIRQEALARLQEVREEKELEELNSSVLGRSGSLTEYCARWDSLIKNSAQSLDRLQTPLKRSLSRLWRSAGQR